MKILRFTLKGRTGFFKKPDVNTYLYFTYGNVHKVALLGIFGAVLGLGGYNSMKLKESLKKKSNKKQEEDTCEYPEFYEKMKDFKVSVVPNAKHGFIPKKVQVFNNSVGYASKEQGGNLIVNEQWLENPSWDIYVAVEDELSEKLAQYILNQKAVYQPYLGKNDHYADIINPEVIDGVMIEEAESIDKIDCLCRKEDFKIFYPDEEDEDDEQDGGESEDLFKYEERLPIALSRETNMYESCAFIFTNMNVKCTGKCTVYKVKNRNITFY